MASPSIFARIISGALPCHQVYDSASVIAFLDINPLAPGHTLVVPKRQVEFLHELPADEAAELGRCLGPVAQRVISAVGVNAYNLLQNNGAASGQEVPHVHFHIIPRVPGDGLGYRWQPKKADTQELARLAERIALA